MTTLNFSHVQISCADTVDPQYCEDVHLDISAMQFYYKLYNGDELVQYIHINTITKRVSYNKIKVFFISSSEVCANITKTDSDYPISTGFYDFQLNLEGDKELSLS